jgi:hypothetical protein
MVEQYFFLQMHEIALSYREEIFGVLIKMLLVQMYLFFKELRKTEIV